MEGVDRLERPQGRVELRGMAIERIERRADALLLVALVGERQVLQPRERLARRALRSGPGLVFHHRIMRGDRPERGDRSARSFRAPEAADRPDGEEEKEAEENRKRNQRLIR